MTKMLVGRHQGLRLATSRCSRAAPSCQRQAKSCRQARAVPDRRQTKPHGCSMSLCRQNLLSIVTSGCRQARAVPDRRPTKPHGRSMSLCRQNLLSIVTSGDSLRGQNTLRAWVRCVRVSATDGNDQRAQLRQQLRADCINVEKTRQAFCHHSANLVPHRAGRCGERAFHDAAIIIAVGEDECKVEVSTHQLRSLR